MPVDGKGDYQPWLSFPLIEHLKGIDFSEKAIFEYGAGASTLFWAKRAKSVTSVEFDNGWFNQLKDNLPANVSLFHEDHGRHYADSIKRFSPSRFDVIVVDGAERYRSARAALDMLAPGGMVILDNAEWYPNTANMLVDAGLIEIRFSGFGPINAFTSTSSVFLSRDAKFALLPEARKKPIGGTDLPNGALDDGAPD
ncbi:class I SAM-dependent methyltransferase [Robbsia andropogonis]|nr:class I SAM-dependent methyltransferase [Robbsia andropogonis]